MEQFIHHFQHEFNEEVKNIQQSEYDIIKESTQIISVLEEAFEKLKKFVTNLTFNDQSEEILFFKEIKPQMFSLLIYYNKVYNIEMRMPNGTANDKKLYLENILGRIKYFFEMNFDFYHYYRSGSTHLDKYYFLRSKPDIQLLLDSFYFERDSRFSTSHDFKVSKILAYEMLTAYINNKLIQLNKDEYSTDTNGSIPKVKLTWTGKKAELVELIYSWDCVGYFNNGNTNIKELAEYIESVFNINLGDFYHTFLEIRERKGSRTQFLDKLIKSLNDRMDNLDNK